MYVCMYVCVYIYIYDLQTTRGQPARSGANVRQRGLPPCRDKRDASKNTGEGSMREHVASLASIIGRHWNSSRAQDPQREAAQFSRDPSPLQPSVAGGDAGEGLPRLWFNIFVLFDVYVFVCYCYMSSFQTTLTPNTEKLYKYCSVTKQ